MPNRTTIGKCLCSDEGCSEECSGLPNALYREPLEEHLISVQQIVGWRTDLINNLHVDQEVAIIRSLAVPDESITQDTPYFERKDTYGGFAKICKWQHCGKRGMRGWHNAKVLAQSLWQVNEDDASILLLTEDGSTGLDLSFCTHIFLLDRIKDPALESQIISRANRMVF